MSTRETYEAALAEDVSVLQRLHASGAPWHPDIAATAAFLQRRDVLEYVHAKGLHWDVNTCSAAVQSGDLATLVFLHSRGCPWDAETPYQAVQKGSMAMLQYAAQQGCPWDTSTTRAAAELDLRMLRYAVEHGCPVDESAVLGAIRFAELETLQYLHEEAGVPFTTAEPLTAAAAAGRYDAVQYLCAKKAPLSTTAVSAAAACGCLLSLQLLLRNGAALTAGTFDAAVSANQGAVLEWLLFKSQCPLPTPQEIIHLYVLSCNGYIQGLLRSAFPYLRAPRSKMLSAAQQADAIAQELQAPEETTAAQQQQQQ